MKGYVVTVSAVALVASSLAQATHRGLAALMDDSATHELSRLARSDIMIVSPDAPGRLIAADGYDTAAQARVATGRTPQRGGGDHHGTPRSAPSWASSCCLRSTPPA